MLHPRTNCNKKMETNIGVYMWIKNFFNIPISIIKEEVEGTKWIKLQFFWGYFQHGTLLKFSTYLHIRTHKAAVKSLNVSTFLEFTKSASLPCRLWNNFIKDNFQSLFDRTHKYLCWMEENIKLKICIGT